MAHCFQLHGLNPHSPEQRGRVKGECAEEQQIKLSVPPRQNCEPAEKLSANVPRKAPKNTQSKAMGFFGPAVRTNTAIRSRKTPIQVKGIFDKGISNGRSAGVGNPAMVPNRGRCSCTKRATRSDQGVASDPRTPALPGVCKKTGREKKTLRT